MKKTFYLLSSVLCCIACSKSPIQSIEKSRSDVIPEKEAMEKLSETLKLLYGNTKSLVDNYSIDVIGKSDLLVNLKSDTQIL